MKKLSLLIIVIIIVISLAACNKNKEDFKDNQINDYDKNVEDIISDAEIKKDGPNEDVSGDISLDINLYSTEDRAVFNFGNAYYLVYNFEGDDVTGLSYYYTYEDEETAKLSYDYFKQALDNNEIGTESIKEAYHQGIHVILISKEDVYEGTTREEIMEAYSYLEQVYEEATSGDLD